VVPWAEFQQIVARARIAIRMLEDKPFARVKEELAAGSAKESFTRTSIEGCPGSLTEEDEAHIKGATSTLYVAASDTTLTVLLVFILEMVLRPEHSPECSGRTR